MTGCGGGCSGRKEGGDVAVLEPRIPNFGMSRAV